MKEQGDEYTTEPPGFWFGFKKGGWIPIVAVMVVVFVWRLFHPPYDPPLPACPNCGGDLVPFEAGVLLGYDPGTRECVGQPIGPDTYDPDGGCGSLFSAQTTEEVEP